MIFLDLIHIMNELKIEGIYKIQIDETAICVMFLSFGPSNIKDNFFGVTCFTGVIDQNT